MIITEFREDFSIINELATEEHKTSLCLATTSYIANLLLAEFAAE